MAGAVSARGELCVCEEGSAAPAANTSSCSDAESSLKFGSTYWLAELICKVFIFKKKKSLA